MFGWFTKKAEATWEHPTEPELLTNYKYLKITDAQFEKIETLYPEMHALINDGFQVNERSPNVLRMSLKKKDYFCEYTLSYEVDDTKIKKVKKVISKLEGQWTVVKKTGKMSGNTNDPYQKWLDWDDKYEYQLQLLEEEKEDAAENARDEE